jgi:hypothetical protein
MKKIYFGTVASWRRYVLENNNNKDVILITQTEKLKERTVGCVFEEVIVGDPYGAKMVLENVDVIYSRLAIIKIFEFSRLVTKLERKKKLAYI